MCEDHIVCVLVCAMVGTIIGRLDIPISHPPSRAVSYYQVFETLNTYGRMMRNSNEVREC